MEDNEDSEENDPERKEHIERRHCEDDRILLLAAVQHNEAASGQHVGADLSAQIVEFRREFRRQILLPLQVDVKKRRHQRGRHLGMNER